MESSDASHLYRQPGEPAPPPGMPPGSVETDSTARATNRFEEAIRCAHCGAAITSERKRVEVDGGDTHVRLNPAGLVFKFGCFSEAPGCAIAGDPTAEDVWFSGYRWQYAHCRSCLTHLGWYFSGPAPFFGLILDRLVGH